MSSASNSDIVCSHWKLLTFYIYFIFKINIFTAFSAVRNCNETVKKLQAQYLKNFNLAQIDQI